MSGEVELLKIVGPEMPRLNAIFVHGLGGDASGTCAHVLRRKHSGILGKLFRRALALLKKRFWPAWLVAAPGWPSRLHADYPSDPRRWRPGWSIWPASVAVLDAMMVSRDLRRNGAPIVFVCPQPRRPRRKKLIVTANIDKGQEPTKGAFLDRIAGVAFLATPHGGSFLATLARELHWAASEFATRSRQQCGRPTASRKPVSKLGGRRRSTHWPLRLLRGMREVAGLKVVDGRSADPGLTGVRPIAVLRDHIGHLQTAEKDEVYNGVLALLEEALKVRPRQTRGIVEDVKDDTSAIRA